MIFQSLDEQKIVRDFLNRNNLFVHNLIKKKELLSFLEELKVYKTELMTRRWEAALL